jgi:hypothetical protein
MATATITVDGIRTTYSATGAGGTTAIRGANTAEKQATIYTLLNILRDQQNLNWVAYNDAVTTNGHDSTEAQTKFELIRTNAATQSNLYKVASEISELNKSAEAVAEGYEYTRKLLSDFAKDQLAEATANAEELISANDGKKRMIELNTYYGKRFNAQAGVVKLFIYTCVPVLILAILANAGLIPTTIAGFIIVIIIVTGLIYIYAAVSDINRRSKMNFDEYEWEFDPSRVGNMSNPNPDYVSKGGMGAGIGSGCANGDCCGFNTIWDPNSGICNAQGTGGESPIIGVASTARRAGGGTFIGDFASP